MNIHPSVRVASIAATLVAISACDHQRPANVGHESPTTGGSSRTQDGSPLNAVKASEESTGNQLSGGQPQTGTTTQGAEANETTPGNTGGTPPGSAPGATPNAP